MNEREEEAGGQEDEPREPEVREVLRRRPEPEGLDIPPGVRTMRALRDRKRVIE